MMRVLPWVYLAAAFVFIYLPVATLVLFSFQDGQLPVPPFNGPSLRWYADVLGDSRLTAGLVLGVVAIGITALVYGAVALLVKMDDVGLKLSQIGRLSMTRSFGRGMVKFMPTLMNIISIVGTAAMLWVGGNIIVHGLEVLGWHLPYETIKSVATAVSESIGQAKGFVKWMVTATLDGVLGLALGLVLMPIVNKVLVPFLGVFFPEKKPIH